MPIQGNKSLPTLTNPSDLIQVVKKWQSTLAPSSGKTPIAPYNLRATPQRGGILVQWNAILTPGDADGYQLQRTIVPALNGGNANVPNQVSTVSLPDQTTVQFFDAVPAHTIVTYRIRATNGTLASPQSVLGVYSGATKAAALDPSDNTTVPVTNYSNGTNDRTQSAAGRAKIVAGTRRPKS